MSEKRANIHFPDDQIWILKFFKKLAKHKNTSLNQEVITVLRQHLLGEKFECQKTREVIKDTDVN
jgi:hypothetical protein